MNHEPARMEKSSGDLRSKKNSEATAKDSLTTLVNSYKYNISLYSEVLHNVLHEDLLHCAKLFLRTLLLSDFNSHQGIHVSADVPRCCTNPIINLKRPAVLRVYYGLSEFTNSSPYVVRPTYGPTRLFSSVGTDPWQYRT